MRAAEPAHRSARPGQHGFGLLEIVISIVLLGLVGSTTFYFLHNQDSNTTLGTDLSKGMFIGKRKLDSLRIIRYGLVQAGSDTVNNRYIRRWYITTDLDTDRKRVDLLVSWPLSASHTITFNTLVSDDQYKVY
jgi:prepilin-type N-terminal cleavage/methylation domain-containing protein